MQSWVEHCLRRSWFIAQEKETCIHLYPIGPSEEIKEAVLLKPLSLAPHPTHTHTSDPPCCARIWNSSQWNIWALKSQDSGWRCRKDGRIRVGSLIWATTVSGACLMSKSLGQARGDKHERVKMCRSSSLERFSWGSHSLYSFSVRIRQIQTGGLC